MRALRHRLAWRQQDLAARADVSQDVISRTERGHIDALPLRRIRRIAAALDAELVVSIRWRSGELDRLLDEGHVAIVGRVVDLLVANGWETGTEVSYSIYGERGSIDVLAWHGPSRTLLVVEVKTELTSIEETLRKHDAKVRLAPKLAAERFGWQPTAVGRLLVLPALSTPRRHVRRHASVMERAYPVRGVALRQKLVHPAGSLAGLLFVPLTHGRRGRQDSVSRKRVRRLGQRAA